MKKLLIFFVLVSVFVWNSLINASPLEEKLAAGPHDIKLISGLKSAASENIDQKSECTNCNVYRETACKQKESKEVTLVNWLLSEHNAGYFYYETACKQKESNGFSLVEWLFFGGKCFDMYTLYANKAKVMSNDEDVTKNNEVAQKCMEAYSIAKDAATNLIKSSSQIIACTENCLLLEYFIMSWFKPELTSCVWRQYGSVVIIALAVYYNAFVAKSNNGGEQCPENLKFYRTYSRAVKDFMR